MIRYIGYRAAQSVVVLILVTVGVFGLVRMSGDPALSLLDADAPAEQVEALRAELGLDKPLSEQYLSWLGDAVQGDLGNSLRTRRPVVDMIAERIPNTVRLGLVALGTAVVFGVPLGIIAALNKGRALDLGAQMFAFLGMAAPAFWVAIMLILVFSVQLGWFPTSGIGGLDHYVLPGITLGFGVITAGMLRLTRSGMLDVLAADFVMMARIKGLRERRVVVVHALRNALLPVVTYLGTYFAFFLSGSVVIEVIFRWPGIGLLGYEGVFWRDLTLLQGILLVVAAWTILVNLVVDVLYAYIDPRIRY